MVLPLTTWTRPRAPEAPPALVLGAMNFGKRTLEPEARRIVDRALERGVVHVDTANAYVEGESERIVGRALAGRREAAIVTTKVGLFRFGGERSGLLQTGGRPEGLSRARILAACDESLGRLGTDYLDFYCLHVPDSGTPIEETLSGIGELLRTGKIRAWGFSNHASWQALEMIAWCDREGVQRPSIAQQLYNLLVRQLDVEYLRFAAKYRLHTAAYNPLAGGLLAGIPTPAPRPGSRFDGNPMYQRRYLSDRMRLATEKYGEIARELGMNLVELSYAWLASRPGIDSIVLGPGTALHLDEALDACTRRLDDDVLAMIDAVHFALEGTDAKYARD